MSPDVHHYSESNQDQGDGLVIVSDHDKKSRPRNIAWNRLLVAIVSLAILAISAAFGYFSFTRRPASAETDTPQYFEIKKGLTTRAIANDLKQAGLIRSSWTFLFIALVERRGVIQAGYYKLAPSMTTDEILEKLQKGEVDAFSVTIPEGYRVLQIAKLLQEKGEISPDKFIEAALGTEGTLFPDTYIFPRNIESAKIVRQMREDYDTHATKLKLTSEQLIIASIVEREAKADDERAKIAAVYKKRADENMLLQADPTVRYALDTQTYLQTKNIDFEFWRRITKADYQNLDSPFNTYKQKGLPPAPICNPGLKSLEAAANPEKDFDYLFFFHDSEQKIHFSKTFQEHQELIQQYGLPGI